jgi:hypothetical protein
MSETDCTQPVYKTNCGLWLVNDERAIGLAFETREQAELVLAMCPFVLNVSELMPIVKPMFRILNIKSKWSE